MKLLYQGKQGLEFSYRVNNLKFPMHVDNATEIFFCTRGSAMVQYAQQSFWLNPGDIFFSFPNQPHGYFDCDVVEGYMLILPVKSVLTEYFSIMTHMEPACPIIRDSHWEESSLGVVLKIAYEERKCVADTVLQGYFAVIVGKLLEKLKLVERGKDTAEAVRKIIFYINENYRKDITRKEIAQALGYNESYISHVFSQSLKTTLPKYLNALRIYDAQRFLMETEMSIAEIAFTLGYGSIRSFNRCFLEESGCTPRKYRQNK